VPSSSPVGRPVTGEVQNACLGLIYEWTVQHPSLAEGILRTYGPRIVITPLEPSPAIFTCVALSGNGFRSAATRVQVRIHPVLAPVRDDNYPCASVTTTPGRLG
jgi:hypothetical protein